MTTTTRIQHALPMILDEVEVAEITRLSPTFMRFGFTAPVLEDFGVEHGPLLDQRIKLIFPEVPGQLPCFDGADESWFKSWLQRPVTERGHMRTFTVRRFTQATRGSLLEVDFALHAGSDCGPAARWATDAQVGDRLVLLGPARGLPYGGIEFAPGAAQDVLLIGDETAVPAISAIVEDGLAGHRARVFLEVPTDSDILQLNAPRDVDVTWLARHGRPRGALLRAAVAEHTGGRALTPAADGDVDDELWETPTYSSSGEALPHSPTSSPGRYAWVAGESSIVTAIRRHLVSDVGLERSQVAFMGYWREGVAMRS